MDPLINLYEISHIRPIQHYENDPFREIDSDSKDGKWGSKIILNDNIFKEKY